MYLSEKQLNMIFMFKNRKLIIIQKNLLEFLLIFGNIRCQSQKIFFSKNCKKSTFQKYKKIIKK